MTRMFLQPGGGQEQEAETSIHTFGPNSHIIIRGTLGDSFCWSARTEYLIQELGRLQAILMASKRTLAQAARSLEITPAEVIQYFEQSPVLNYMVDDVRAVLGQEQGQPVSQLEQDLAQCAGLGPDCIQADVAEKLFGKRAVGGSQHARVKAVHAVLTSSSTPLESPETGVEELKRAA